jgi:hypothetical protein
MSLYPSIAALILFFLVWIYFKDSQVPDVNFLFLVHLSTAFSLSLLLEYFLFRLSVGRLS